VSWAITNYEGFTGPYERARQIQFHRWADEILTIADDGRQDIVIRRLPDGATERVVNHEHISRSKLRIDSRKWILSKLLPSKFGDGVASELTGANGGPIKTEQSFADFKQFPDEDLWTLREILKRRAAAEDEGEEGANG
jgi:hypothetical protein